MHIFDAAIATHVSTRPRLGRLAVPPPVTNASGLSRIAAAVVVIAALTTLFDILAERPDSSDVNASLGVDRI